jgi:hypothetical protein
MRNLSITYGDQSAQLKEIRAGDSDGQGRHSFTAQQQTLRRLNVVFGAYFKRVRRAEMAGRQAGMKGETLQRRRVGYQRYKPRQRFTITRCSSSLGTAPNGSPLTMTGGRTRPSRRSGESG